MNLSLPTKLRVKLSKVFWITLLWTIFGVLEVLYIHVLSFDFPSFKAEPSYSFQDLLMANLIAVFLGGLIAGCILVFILRGRFRDHSFMVSVFLNTLILLLILLVVIGIGTGIFHSYHANISFFSQSIFNRVIQSFLSYIFLSKLTLWLLIIFLTNLLLDVNEKYGAGVLRQLIIGKYHHPREEERIFMFLDMKGSTGIAEQIGHIKFFELLHDFFQDITDPILFTNGSIYQYIGDEVIIVWKIPTGVKNGNCIRCFYNIRETISRNADNYLEKYGIVPEFKAGIHCGKVTIGEIGVLKRDIVFSGDVLNTTARMQSMCNEFGLKLLISKKLLDLIGMPPNRMDTRKIGNISLKGKKKKVVLYTIEEEQTRV